MEDYKIFYIEALNIYFFTKSNLNSRIKTAKTNAINEYLASKGLPPSKILTPHIFTENITSTRTGVINKIKELNPEYKPVNKSLNNVKRNDFNNTHIVKCNICDKDVKYFSAKAHFNTRKHRLFSEAINSFNQESFEKSVINGFCVCCSTPVENLEEHTKSESHYRNYIAGLVNKKNKK